MLPHLFLTSFTDEGNSTEFNPLPMDYSLGWLKLWENGWPLKFSPQRHKTILKKQACAVSRVAPTHEIRINEDISLPSSRVIVMLPWSHGKPLGKSRTTLIRKRVIVFGKHEQSFSEPVPLALCLPLMVPPWGTQLREGRVVIICRGRWGERA